MHAGENGIDDGELERYPRDNLLKKSRKESRRTLFRVQRADQEIASGKEFGSQSALLQRKNDNVVFLPEGTGQVESNN